MDIEKAGIGDILGKEETTSGRWWLVCGPVSQIDKERNIIAITVKEGKNKFDRPFNAAELWPIHAIVFGRNKRIAELKGLLGKNSAVFNLLVTICQGAVNDCPALLPYLQEISSEEEMDIESAKRVLTEMSRVVAENLGIQKETKSVLQERIENKSRIDARAFTYKQQGIPERNVRGA